MSLSVHRLEQRAGAENNDDIIARHIGDIIQAEEKEVGQMKCVLERLELFPTVN